MLHRFITRLLLRTAALDDPWARFAHAVPLHRYGLGARRDFRWYFEGESTIPVTSLAEVQDWLLGCAYVRDPDLFQTADFWQHPLTFEQLRRGDCEDFTLWAWRKLVRLGYDAEFVAGHAAQPGACPGGHTWILLRDGGEPRLFDPVLRRRALMIRPLEAVRYEDVPEVSVDRRFARYAYAGYLLRRHGNPRAVLTRPTPAPAPLA